MQTFLSARNFSNFLKRQNKPLEALFELVSQNGFHGLEISDRELPLTDLSYLNLTRLEESEFREQVNYALNSLEAAETLGACKVRVLLGGQSFSLQKLFFLLQNKRKKKMAASNKPPGLLKRMSRSNLAGRLAHQIRRNSSVTIKDEKAKVQRAIQSLEQLVPKAEKLKIPLVIENHWGISSNPKNMITIIKHFDSPCLGSCPDFENFPKASDRFAGLALLAKHALHVHAKTGALDHKRVRDFNRSSEILRQVGYDGTIAIEYEGSSDVLAACLEIKSNLS